MMKRNLLLTALFLQSLNANTIEKSGDALLLLLPSSALLSTLYLDDEEGSWQLAKGAITNVLVTYTLKYTIHKTRPNGEDDRSFPSGHTSATFQAASFIHKRYGLTYGAAAYALAAYTGYTRIQSDKHYTEDVLAGALIGVLSSYTFTSAHGVHYQPIMISRRVGVSASWQW